MCRVAYMLCSVSVLRFYPSLSRTLLISPLQEQPGFSVASIHSTAAEEVFYELRPNGVLRRARHRAAPGRSRGGPFAGPAFLRFTPRCVLPNASRRIATLGAPTRRERVATAATARIPSAPRPGGIGPLEGRRLGRGALQPPGVLGRGGGAGRLGGPRRQRPGAVLLGPYP